MNTLNTQGAICEDVISVSAAVSFCAQASKKSSAMSGSWVFARSISGLVAEYIVAIDVTRVRFPADAFESESMVSQASNCSCSTSQGSAPMLSCRVSFDAACF